ncbi:hypothetical protein ASE74_07380 [Pedobacter sp. Leaf216]|nr:hypothetical protein ASE74_07380 [Pedobacter sp. Leaf216]
MHKDLFQGATIQLTRQTFLPLKFQMMNFRTILLWKANRLFSLISPKEKRKSNICFVQIADTLKK